MRNISSSLSTKCEYVCTRLSSPSPPLSFTPLPLPSLFSSPLPPFPLSPLPPPLQCTQRPHSRRLQKDFLLGILPSHVGSYHRPGYHATSCFLLGQRLARSSIKETSRDLLSLSCNSGIVTLSQFSIMDTALGSQCTGIVWVVYGEKWAGQQTIPGSTRDTRGAPGQSVSVSRTPESCPVALFIHAIHCPWSSLPSNLGSKSVCSRPHLLQCDTYL